jgi:SNF2 family DNA or RNA helicase
MHHSSHLIWQVDPPENIAQDQQCLGRAFRIGQDEDVYIFRIVVPDSYNIWVHKRAFSKSIGELRASIDAAELAKQTGVRILEDEDEEEFLRTLKKILASFHLDKS